MVTIYEYILITQPDVLVLLRGAGLLVGQPEKEKDLTRADIAALMRHDHWRRVRGALRQIDGRVVG